jgi:rhamnosyltransferase
VPDKAISVVVRTYNESAFLGRLIDVLAQQTDLAGQPQITVVDSGSTDATVRIARSRGVNLIEIPKADFHYSKALNLGIQKSVGDLLVILSAHSIPSAPNWLSVMLSHFRDERTAGVFSRQLAWPDAYWREVVRIKTMFGDSSRTFDSAVITGDVPFSNAASCIRRSVWEQRPFILPAAEDIEWATWAVGAGYRIVYEAGASVYHSHDETSRQAARRLIELEKAADIRLSRARGPMLTTRQAGGAVLRDIAEIRRHTPVTAGRLGLVWDSILRSYWFARDFD